MKKIINIIPEAFFIGVGITWLLGDYQSGSTINYFALLVTWLMFLQVFYKNRILGLVYGNVLGLVSIYLLAAMYSEFKAFEVFSMESVKMIAFGSGVIIAGLVMSIAMVYKFAIAKTDYDESVLTVTY